MVCAGLQGSYGGQLGLNSAGRTEQDMACQGRVGYDREWWSRAGQPEELAQN